METNEQLKNLVKESYTKIAEQSKSQNESSCCGAAGCCSDEVDYATFAEDYKKLKGYNPDADLGLGCGVPTVFAQIKEGDTVIDLGSGAGNDVFVARAITGKTGRVIGIDMTDAMIEKARKNNNKLGFTNVEFRFGDIENLPVEDNTADVTISNCVLNLVPDKKKAFKEIYRTMKSGGHFSVSDIVIKGNLPQAVKIAGELYAGCIGGAIDINEYLNIINQTGFINVEVQKEREISIPDSVLLGYIDQNELEALKASGAKILSVNVYAKKQ
ncbi:MAG TPA: arsenite methyltransferase [Ignavibacteria bacterium]|jgi:SAM-dependent methyltransferase